MQGRHSDGGERYQEEQWVRWSAAAYKHAVQEHPKQLQKILLLFWEEGKV